ncbi:helix-turn-helix domain-containing protein [Steroidobacter flavus]|uniref:Helix-turn-helix domain-containing protein n=1 Tax=Steroidobacter flavus TaxID=1842136 RepID=A0ABV8SLW9_9GAMM
MSAAGAESRAYFRALGKRITTLRKSQQMTQTELARAIGVSPQAVCAYEIGERRVSVLLLARITKLFPITADKLMGMEEAAPVPKRRLSWRAMRHAERLQALSRTQQRFVVSIIDVLEDRSPPS